MKRMISACLRFEAPDLWLAVPVALFPVLVSEVTALMAATEDDPEALVLLPGVGMILTVVLCCVLGGVYLCSNFPLLLQFSASRRGSLAGLCLHILRMTVLAEVIAAAAIMALGAVSHGFCRWRTLALHPGFCVAGLRRAAGAGGTRVGRRTHPVWPHRRLGAILFVYRRVFQRGQMAAPAGRAAVDGGVSRGRAGGTGHVRGKVVDESGGEIVTPLV